MAGLSALSAFGGAVMNSRGKNGKINWKDPSLYIGGSMAALGAGLGSWMSYGNNGGNGNANANANGNGAQK